MKEMRENMKCKNCNHLEEVHEVTPGTEKIYYWCSVKNDCPDVEIECDCDRYEGMSNADRIRDMTNEELAEFLLKDRYESIDKACDDCDIVYDFDKELCKECYLYWLQKEVE